MQFLDLYGAGGEPSANLDAILANPRAYPHLPQVTWAFDPVLGICRRVQWANPREPREIRRTALAVARVEAVDLRQAMN